MLLLGLLCLLTAGAGNLPGEKILGLVSLKTNKKGFKEYRNVKDGSTLILVPSGVFKMGSENQADEKPLHKVILGAYLIGKCDVTVGQFRNFCKESGRKMPEQPEWNQEDSLPVVNVSWSDAQAYCAWAGLRLPTEAEWEKAARGTDGRTYPWGNVWNGKLCNHGSDEGWYSDTSDSYVNTSPVGSFPKGASPCGALDMAGNVWQWCEDWYSPTYYNESPDQNPLGPKTGTECVLRGGSWMYFTSFCRASARQRAKPGEGTPYYGFRCARGME